jgi:hypothetical protein
MDPPKISKKSLRLVNKLSLFNALNFVEQVSFGLDKKKEC